MIFKINFDTIDLLINKYPYIRYNESEFYLIEESYYSKNNKKEIPWQNPKNVIIHRRTSNFSKDPNLDFEKDINSFKEFIKYFFNFEIAKTFLNLKHFLIIGQKDHLQASEISNWDPLEEVLNKGDLFEYLYMGRFLIRIPLGPLNLNIIKLYNYPDLYLEITSVTKEPENINNIIKDLNLQNGINKNWTDVYLDCSGS